MSKFKIGDKVIPISKSVGISFERYCSFNEIDVHENNNYLYITNIEENIIYIRHTKHGNDLYRFLQQDLIKFKKILEDE